MKNPIQISIPQPCHENWATMTPVDKGRFCASCQKNVVDFTRSSDREILEALKTGGQACGRFRASQLNRELYVPKEKSKFWAAASAAAITLLTVGVNETAAQTPIPAEQGETKSSNIDEPKTENIPDKISGTVVDNDGIPIPGVNVKISGSVAIPTHTDIDGIFSIEAKEGDTLEFSYNGLATVKTKVSEKSRYTMEMVEMEFAGLIVTGYSESSHIGVASQYMFGY